MTTIKAMENKAKELKVKVDYAYAQLVETKMADANAWELANDNYLKAFKAWADAESALFDMM